MRISPARLAPVVALTLVACAHKPNANTQTQVAPTLAGDASHPAHAQGWVDTRLYFGLGLANHPEEGISEADWRDFLDREVTPRFPSGLSARPEGVMPRGW